MLQVTLTYEMAQCLSENDVKFTTVAMWHGLNSAKAECIIAVEHDTLSEFVEQLEDDLFDKYDHVFQGWEDRYDVVCSMRDRYDTNLKLYNAGLIPFSEPVLFARLRQVLVT